jgi:hypothetical protein
MALVVKDRVKQQTTTTGTGTLTLSGSYTGFDAFSQIGDGNTTYYVITDDVTSDWEVGLGTYTAAGTTLSRDTILASSNAGSAVDLAAGTKVVFCGYPAGKAVYLDASGNLGISGTVSATSITGATVTATSNMHTPTISVTNLQASTVTATSNMHTPTISVTDLQASTVTATSNIHTPALSATNIIAATITATTKIHTVALSATTISATNVIASGNVNADVVSATTLLRSGSQLVAPIVSATIIRASSEMIAPTVSATRVVTTSITTDVVFGISGQYGDELDSGFTPVYLLLNSPFSFTINSFTGKLSAGAITVSVIVATSAAGPETTVTGLNGLAINTVATVAQPAGGDNTVSPGNALLMKLTGVALTDRNFAFTLKCTRTNFSGA